MQFVNFLLMKNIKLIFFFLSTPIVLSSCLNTYGRDISKEYTNYSTSYDCSDRPIKINLFELGTPINSTFTSLGNIVLTGGEYDSYEDLYNHLKYETWKKCGNAAIITEQSQTQRESGLLFSKEEPEVYFANVIKAKIVKTKINSQSQSITHSDTAYAGIVTRENKRALNGAAARFGASLVLGIGVGVAWIAEQTNPN